MSNSRNKSIGFVFLEKFADWEYGLLSASARDWFSAETIALSLLKDTVSSLGGFKLIPDRSIDDEKNADLNAIVLVGSENWASGNAPDISPLLNAIGIRGGIIGGICGGTLALARAGFFKEHQHTSNGVGWIESKIGNYPGSSLYRDVPHAVRDKQIISAAGPASNTFAISFLEALFPEQHQQIAEIQALITREHKRGQV